MSDAIYLRTGAGAVTASVLTLLGLIALATPAAADFRLCNNTASRVGVAVGYKDAERLDHGRLVESALALVRDRAQGQSRRAFLLCLCH